MISTLFNPKVIQFIQDHLDNDPAELVLKRDIYPDIPIKEVAEQIASRQKIVSKLPEWYKNLELIFPNKQNLEQASSERTSRFKARWVNGTTFLDLTGGSGVDTFYLSQQFSKSTYVEPNEKLYELAEHNFNILDAPVTCINSSAENFLKQNSKKFDLIYLDPSRRNNKKERVYGIEEYQPNIVELFDILVHFGSSVLVKVSPMVDIKSTIDSMPGTSKVQVLAVNNEVKEVLFYIRKGFSGKVEIEAWNLGKEDEEELCFTFEEEIKTTAQYSEPLTYIYDSNSAIRKAGAFNVTGNRYGLSKLHPNTHLYTSREIVQDFPGRTFEVKRVLKASKKEVQKAIPSRKANVISKNFVLGANELKKKYQLKDGGEEFLIFCESISLGKVCIHCARV